MIRRIDSATLVLPLLGIGVMLLIWTVLSPNVARRSAFAAENLAGEQAVYSQSVFQRRRDESGHLRLCLLKLDPGGQRVSARDRHRHASGISCSGSRAFFHRPLIR